MTALHGNPEQNRGPRRWTAALLSIACAFACERPSPAERRTPAGTAGAVERSADGGRREHVERSADGGRREYEARVDAPASAAPAPSAPVVPIKVERKEAAMGTQVTFIAYTDAERNEAALRSALDGALAEMRRLESVLSEWRPDSEVGLLNAAAGQWVKVGPETAAVLDKALWAGRLSQGTFDVTFQVMGDLWKFGSAREDRPHVPERGEIARRKKSIDYRRIELDLTGGRARIGADQKIGLGGIAKGFIVDRAVEILRKAGLRSFLVQAGGDLYGAGKKPDGSRWVSGIQDPRGASDRFFASIELEDAAFSTAGDYARAYVVGGKRYHHIIDPRTGYPATASRSVTVWAKDALTADVVDDAVFILGPERGLELVASLEGVGVVIVDAKNEVWVSPRLTGKVRLVSKPSDGI